MTRAERYFILKEKYKDDIEAFSEIERTCRKMEEHFTDHDRIMISVSGGSDSDCIVHLVCTYFSEYLDKISFVFVDTGLEYAATKRHLYDLETKYRIKIDRIRGTSVVTAVRKFGVPILNKSKAHMVELYLRRTPKGYYLCFEMHGMYELTDNERNLVQYLDKNNIKVSSKCCDVSKKKPVHEYSKQHKIDLSVSGERKAEGGVRATSHKSCFETKKDGVDKFMPLLWWSDDVKSTFKKEENIRYSDCYEVWGMKRTGCVGCPFGKDTAEELQMMMKYEPNLYKACMNVFGVAYELTDRFNCRKKKKLSEYVQLMFDFEENEHGKDV